MSSVYGMKTAVDEMMNESKSIMDYALKQSMSIDYLGRLDSDDIKAMASLTHMADAIERFLKAETEAVMAIYERQKEIDSKLYEINKKLDKLSKDE